MKPIAILSVFLLLVMNAYGQSKENKIPDHLGIRKTEIVSSGLQADNNKSGPNYYNPKNTNPYQNNWLKSSQETRLGIDSLVIKVSEEGTENWITYIKEEFTYDGWGHTIRSIFNDIEEGGTLEARWKSEYTYDFEGKMIQKLNYDISERTKLWILKDMEEYNYDANGNMIRCMEKGWNDKSKQWIEYGKEEYSYDDNGSMTQSVDFYNDGQWRAQYKHEYNYNENDVLIRIVGYRMGESIPEWIPIDKIIYTLDEKNNIIQAHYFNWDEANEKWSDGWMEEYTYDELGNITQNSQCEWEDEQKAYFGKFEYSYDNSFTFSDLLIPVFDDDISIIEALDINVLFKHKLDNFIVYFRDAELNEWSPFFRGDYHYSQHNISSVTELSTEVVRILPNPFSDYISIYIPNEKSTSTFELYDLQGHKVIYTKVGMNERINLRKLDCGIYIYTLTTVDGKIFKGKLVKQ